MTLRSYTLISLIVFMAAIFFFKILKSFLSVVLHRNSINGAFILHFVGSYNNKLPTTLFRIRIYLVCMLHMRGHLLSVKYITVYIIHLVVATSWLMPSCIFTDEKRKPQTE